MCGFEKQGKPLTPPHLNPAISMLGIADAHVLHDRPPRFFGPTPVEARHALFLRIKPQLDAWGIETRYSQATGVRVGPSETPFTATDPRTGLPALRPEAERAVLVMSSTSWTEDEDFGLLLDALVAVDRRWAGAAAEGEGEDEDEEGGPRRRRSVRGAGSSKASLQGMGPPRPFLVVAVTGKGPLKAHYEARILALRLRRVAVCTLWLEAADYPLLVGSADLGVCLHESTSGIDLPMKVLDMFGAGLPVCALRFRCLAELVRDQVSRYAVKGPGPVAIAFAFACAFALCPLHWQSPALRCLYQAKTKPFLSPVSNRLTAQENGLVFSSAAELAGALDALLGRLPQGQTQLLGRLRAGVEGMARWEENWEEHAAPLLCGDDEALGRRRYRGWGLLGLLLGLLALLLGLLGLVALTAMAPLSLLG